MQRNLKPYLNTKVWNYKTKPQNGHLTFSLSQSFKCQNNQTWNFFSFVPSENKIRQTTTVFLSLFKTKIFNRANWKQQHIILDLKPSNWWYFQHIKINFDKKLRHFIKFHIILRSIKVKKEKEFRLELKHKKCLNTCFYYLHFHSFFKGI